jgi:hypothetical protein
MTRLIVLKKITKLYVIMNNKNKDKNIKITFIIYNYFIVWLVSFIGYWQKKKKCVKLFFKI